MNVYVKGKSGLGHIIEGILPKRNDCMTNGETGYTGLIEVN